jgi:hypothetical protein
MRNGVEKGGTSRSTRPSQPDARGCLLRTRVLIRAYRTDGQMYDVTVEKPRQLRRLNKTPSLDVEQRPAKEAWHDLPVDFVLWKHIDEGRSEQLESIVSQLDDAGSHDILDRIVSQSAARYGWRTRSHRMRLGVRFTSSQVLDFDPWEMIVSIVGLTTDDLTHSDAAFAAVEFAYTAWKTAQERAASFGHALEMAIGTEPAAALSVLKWILDNDDAIVSRLQEADWFDIEAIDHGPFFVVSLDQGEGEASDFFLVHVEGGAVSRLPISHATSKDSGERPAVDKPEDMIARSKGSNVDSTLTRTILGWGDLPVDLAFWKYSREENVEFLEAVARAVDEEVSHDDLVETYTNRLGEPVELYRVHLSLRLTSRRAYGTAAWDAIFNVIGITASVMGVTAGTFAAAKFVAKVWMKAKDKASDYGYDDEISVCTRTAAALLAANWLMENDPETALKLASSNDAHLHASDHGPYFVVSITSSTGDMLFIVATHGGNVTRIPLPPKNVED